VGDTTHPVAILAVVPQEGTDEVLVEETAVAVGVQTKGVAVEAEVGTERNLAVAVQTRSETPVPKDTAVPTKTEKETPVPTETEKETVPRSALKEVQKNKALDTKRRNRLKTQVALPGKISFRVE